MKQQKPLKDTISPLDIPRLINKFMHNEITLQEEQFIEQWICPNLENLSSFVDQASLYTPPLSFKKSLPVTISDDKKDTEKIENTE